MQEQSRLRAATRLPGQSANAFPSFGIIRCPAPYADSGVITVGVPPAHRPSFPGVASPGTQSTLPLVGSARQKPIQANHEPLSREIRRLEQYRLDWSRSRLSGNVRVSMARDLLVNKGRDHSGSSWIMALQFRSDFKPMKLLAKYELEHFRTGRKCSNPQRQDNHGRPQRIADLRQGRRRKQLFGGRPPPPDANLHRQPPHRRTRRPARCPPARAFNTQPAPDRRSVRRSRTCPTQRRAQRHHRHYRLEPASNIAGLLRLSAPPSLSDSLLAPLVRRVPGILPQRPGPDPRHRPLRRSYRRRCRSWCSGLARSRTPRSSPGKSSATGTSLLQAQPISAHARHLRHPRTCSATACWPFSHWLPDNNWHFAHIDGKDKETLTFIPYFSMNDYTGLGIRIARRWRHR